MAYDQFSLTSRVADETKTEYLKRRLVRQDELTATFPRGEWQPTLDGIGLFVDGAFVAYISQRP